MGIEPTEDASQRPPPVLKTGPRTSQGRATAAESSRFLQWGQSKSSCAYSRGWPQDRARIDSNGGGNAPNAASPHRDEVRRRVAEPPEGARLAREAQLLRPGGGERAGRLDRHSGSGEREAS